MELLIFLAILLVAVLVARALAKRETPSLTAAQLLERLDTVEYTGGVGLEHLVADILRGLGASTEVVGRAGDQGVDVIMWAEGKKIAIQCKNYSRPVGNSAVQEVYAGAHHHDCKEAWVIARNGFTKGASLLAKSLDVSLYDADSLRAWISRINETDDELQGKKLEDGTADLGNHSAKYNVVRDLDERESAEMQDNAGMEKHTVEVGLVYGDIGETVSFTAKSLGTAIVNGGKDSESEEGLDLTFYRLPDGCYRVLVEYEGIRMLEPSDMTEAIEAGRQINYGRWTEEELLNTEEYGEMFAKFMGSHPETTKKNVRDID